MSQAAEKIVEAQAGNEPHLTVVKTEEQDTSSSLLRTIGEMGETLETMRDIIQKANFIALNASIEAARTQTQTENFSLVADQVRRQAERTEELAKSLTREVGELEVFALHAIAIKFTDAANDIIDKIDRNLFERNCDMQAWAQFKENVNCATALVGLNAEVIRAIQVEPNFQGPERHLMQAACHRLDELRRTYHVYSDVFLLNDRGVVVAAGKNANLIGTDLSHEPHFKGVMQKGEPFVSDVYFDSHLDAYVVAYNAPIMGPGGQVIGVVSNRFDWSYVQEMIDKMPLGNETDIHIVSSEGVILSNKKRKGLLKDHFLWLTAGEQAIEKKSGFTIECARNGRLSAWGFCHTFGYNAYRGKGWSAIISHPVTARHVRFISETISREVDGRKQAAPNANNNLERVAASIQQYVRSINSINNETNMLAVNAAIQAGVAGAEGEAFSVIASEIGKLARQSEDFVNKVNTLTHKLSECVRNTVYTRLGEAAFDTIDKIDRNLYERNCDIQAFANFDELKGFNKHGADRKEILDLLQSLHRIYEVYHDIYLLDREGTILAAAVHRETIGQNQADRAWFRQAIGGQLVVTDLYLSRTINDYSVTFAAPIRDEHNEIIGVLTTRFNCDYIFDIMKATVIGPENSVYLVNSKGTVIGSPDGEGILEDSFAHLKAFRELGKNHFGYTLEKDSKQNGNAFAFGYAKTKGYIDYKGKGWSVMIKRKIEHMDE